MPLTSSFCPEGPVLQGTAWFCDQFRVFKYPPKSSCSELPLWYIVQVQPCCKTQQVLPQSNGAQLPAPLPQHKSATLGLLPPWWLKYPRENTYDHLSLLRDPTIQQSRKKSPAQKANPSPKWVQSAAQKRKISILVSNKWGHGLCKESSKALSCLAHSPKPEVQLLGHSQIQCLDTRWTHQPWVPQASAPWGHASAPNLSPWSPPGEHLSILAAVRENPAPCQHKNPEEISMFLFLFLRF